jgi:hypothetical protein
LARDAFSFPDRIAPQGLSEVLRIADRRPGAALQSLRRSRRSVRPCVPAS